ncbi:hypothetical protein EYF80_001807 [Liparis tanakae]|uniref:Uncharacterized protein n=1 Tax=Liparis tanakae TaxID=230148 RepID=A0A4Z2JDL0_9TELE|nr:hypothetical protein EYF80_001807 [Liparis tanakae]
MLGLLPGGRGAAAGVGEEVGAEIGAAMAGAALGTGEVFNRFNASLFNHLTMLPSSMRRTEADNDDSQCQRPPTEEDENSTMTTHRGSMATERSVGRSADMGAWPRHICQKY